MPPPEFTWKLRQIKSNVRRKYNRTVEMVTTVGAILIICFMPTDIGFIVVVITKLRNAQQCNSFNTARHFFYNTSFLTYMNCMINPVVNYFLNLSFNNALMKALLRLKLKSGRPVTSQETEQEGSMDGQTAARQMIPDTPLWSRMLTEPDAYFIR